MGGRGGIPPRPLFSAFAFFAGAEGRANFIGAPPKHEFIVAKKQKFDNQKRI
jgi:hypothetical protein